MPARRVNSDHALFPYYTDDKITEAAEDHRQQDHRVGRGRRTGAPSGVAAVLRPGPRRLPHRAERLYKNAYGNKVIFEETNHDLGLTFRYQWSASERSATCARPVTPSLPPRTPAKVSVLDGIQNLLPHGVPEGLRRGGEQPRRRLPRSASWKAGTLGLYALERHHLRQGRAQRVPRRSNVVRSVGLDTPTVLLCSKQLNTFRTGGTIETETDIKAERGASPLGDFELAAGEGKDWMMVADLGQSIRGVIQLKKDLQSPDQLRETVLADIEAGSERLIALVAASDGLQLAADRRRNIRHFANTMFNIMRGGIFDENYTIERADFMAYIDRANHKVFFKKQGGHGQLAENVLTCSSCRTRLPRPRTSTSSACAPSTCR